MSADTDLAEPRLMYELKVPVFTGCMVASDEIPTYTPGEYLIVERWSDFTIRHPTRDTRVTVELWDRDRDEAIRILRTEGR